MAMNSTLRDANGIRDNVILISFLWRILVFAVTLDRFISGTIFLLDTTHHKEWYSIVNNHHARLVHHHLSSGASPPLSGASPPFVWCITTFRLVHHHLSFLIVMI
jgi:hypothetical protein